MVDVPDDHEDLHGLRDVHLEHVALVRQQVAGERLVQGTALPAGTSLGELRHVGAGLLADHQVADGAVQVVGVGLGSGVSGVEGEDVEAFLGAPHQVVGALVVAGAQEDVAVDVGDGAVLHVEVLERVRDLQLLHQLEVDLQEVRVAHDERVHVGVSADAQALHHRRGSEEGHGRVRGRRGPRHGRAVHQEGAGALQALGVPVVPHVDGEVEQPRARHGHGEDGLVLHVAE